MVGRQADEGSFRQPEVGEEGRQHADIGVHVGDGRVVELVVFLRAGAEGTPAGDVRRALVQQVLLDERERAERRPGHHDVLMHVHQVQPVEAVARVGVVQQAVEGAADEVGRRVGVEPRAPAELICQLHAAVAGHLHEHLVDVRMALAVLGDGPQLVLVQRRQAPVGVVEEDALPPVLRHDEVAELVEPAPVAVEAGRLRLAGVEAERVEAGLRERFGQRGHAGRDAAARPEAAVEGGHEQPGRRLCRVPGGGVGPAEAGAPGRERVDAGRGRPRVAVAGEAVGAQALDRDEERRARHARSQLDAEFATDRRPLGRVGDRAEVVLALGRASRLVQLADLAQLQGRVQHRGPLVIRHRRFPPVCRP